jgi:hypothetical protein
MWVGTVVVCPNFRQIEFRHWDPPEPHGQAETASRKIVPIEGEKAADHTTGRRMPSSVLSPHRYHPAAEEKEVFL